MFSGTPSASGDVEGMRISSLQGMEQEQGGERIEIERESSLCWAGWQVEINAANDKY